MDAVRNRLARSLDAGGGSIMVYGGAGNDSAIHAQAQFGTHQFFDGGLGNDSLTVWTRDGGADKL